MYVCRLFDYIEIRANPLLYKIAQYIKYSVDSTIIKIRKEKNVIYKIYNLKKKQLFQIVEISWVLPLDLIEIRLCQFFQLIDLVTIGEVNHS
jgi:hypothetical protein